MLGVQRSCVPIMLPFAMQPLPVASHVFFSQIRRCPWRLRGAPDLQSRSRAFDCRSRHTCVLATLDKLFTPLKPSSITLASSELAPNMFGASSELVRSWFEAEIWRYHLACYSELARASRFAANSITLAGSELAPNMFGASVMEFGTNQLRTCSEPAPN